MNHGAAIHHFSKWYRFGSIPPILLKPASFDRQLRCLLNSIVLKGLVEKQWKEHKRKLTPKGSSDLWYYLELYGERKPNGPEALTLG